MTPTGARRVLDVGSQTSMSVGASTDPSMLWMHGGFWYQGEYVFEPLGADRTIVTYRIRNISGLPDWLIRTWQRRRLESQQESVDRLAAQLPGRITS